MPELEGVVPPVVTPFDDAGDVDEAALRAEMRYHLDAGVHGISVAGSTGEGNALSVEEHGVVYRAAVEEVGDDVPVVAGVISTNARDATEKARVAREAGADYVMATPPYYQRPTDDGLVDYFAAIGEVGLPILIYDVIEKVDVTAELAARIAGEVPELYGIKQSGGDMHGLANMLTTVGKDLCIMTALDDLLYPSFVLGADGTIGGVTSIYPRVSVELWDAVQSGDHDRARTIHEATLPLARRAVWAKEDNFPGSVKAAIDLLGRGAGSPRNPIRLPEGGERERLADAIETMRDHGVYEND
jgi:4-hydroxy-tetrahydrodipicolinate synthase